MKLLPNSPPGVTFGGAQPLKDGFLQSLEELQISVLTQGMARGIETPFGESKWGSAG